MKNCMKNCMKNRMNKAIMITTMSLFMAFSISTLSLAASSHGSSHGTDAGGATHEMSAGTTHDMASSGGMSQDTHNGNKMHSSMVGDYHFNYELIDMREKMKGMKNMPEMKATHHMMLFIKFHNDHAHMLDKAKVGYFVKNPDGTTQKMMAMGMGNGFGADVNFADKGVYTIKVKAVAGDEKLMDTFKYEVK